MDVEVALSLLLRSQIEQDFTGSALPHLISYSKIQLSIVSLKSQITNPKPITNLRLLLRSDSFNSSINV